MDLSAAQCIKEAAEIYLVESKRVWSLEGIRKVRVHYSTSFAVFVLHFTGQTKNNVAQSVRYHTVYSEHYYHISSKRWWSVLCLTIADSTLLGHSWATTTL